MGHSSMGGAGRGGSFAAQTRPTLATVKLSRRWGTRFSLGSEGGRGKFWGRRLDYCGEWLESKEWN